MAKTILRDLACPSCGKGNSVKTYIGINTAEDPLLKAAVKDGSLFVWECPHCGRRNLQRSQLLYHDPDERLMVWLLPDGMLSPERETEISRILEKRFTEPENGLDDYTFRRVGSTGELIEKVHLQDAGLDDVVMEMAKWVTRNEMADKDKANAEEILRAPLKFYRMNGADNEIQLSFPLNGAMQMVSIGFNVYEDCRGIVQRNPSMRPGTGFVRVDGEWIARFIR